MDKNAHSDIAAFPELFGDMDQFIEEVGLGIRRAGLKLAIAAIPGSALLILALGKVI